MNGILSPLTADFLGNYAQDVPVRWSADDLAAQKQFVNGYLEGPAWLDLSSPSVALEMLQAAITESPGTTGGRFDALVLAGPATEVIQPAVLFDRAISRLNPGGVLIGIIPCLRDNSPESQLFMETAERILWPYHTAEELDEMLMEVEEGLEEKFSQFVPIRSFKEGVLRDRMAFKGFRAVFVELENQGYDPMEVGWGEWRFVSRVP